MNIEIKDRLTGEIIATGKSLTKVAEYNKSNLLGADLREADLLKANLCEANLSEANLCGANLRGADLRGANLCGANLRGADLRWAELRGANLRGAELRWAELRWADLREADLRGADLRGADLNWADLFMADLNWASHDLISEIIRKAAAGDVEKSKIAGLILVCREKCWQHFLSIDDPLQGWALEVLSQWEGCPAVEPQPDEVDA